MVCLILFIMLLHFSMQELAIVFDNRYPLSSHLSPYTECCHPTSQYHRNQEKSLVMKKSLIKSKFWFDGKVVTGLSQKEWLYIIHFAWDIKHLKRYNRRRPMKKTYDGEMVHSMGNQNMSQPLNDAETHASPLSPWTMRGKRFKVRLRDGYSPDSEMLKDVCKSVWDSLIKPHCFKLLEAEIYTSPCKISLGLSCIICIRLMQLFKLSVQLIERILKHNSVLVVLLHKWIYGGCEVFNLKSRQNILSTLSTASCHRKQRWWEEAKEALKVFEDDNKNLDRLAFKGHKRQKKSIMESPLNDFTFWQWKAPIEASVFVAFSLEDKFQRLATFRSLSFGNVAFPKSFVILSESGFYYPGSGVSVVCFGCGHPVDPMKFTSDPWETWYHHPQGCRFVRDPSIMEASLGQQDTMSSNSPQVHNALRDNSNGAELTVTERSALEGCDKDQQFHAGAHSCIKDQESQKCEELTQSTPAGAHSGIRDQESQKCGEPSQSTPACSLVGQPVPDSSVLGHPIPSQVTAQEPKADPTILEKGLEPVRASGGHDERMGVKEDHLSEWEDSSLFTMEQGITRSNGEPKKTWNTTCPKNPGHHTMFPLPMLNLIHLPEAISTSEVLDFIHHLGELTVRIVVRCSSKHRPPDPVTQRVKGKRSGTGFVISVEKSPRKMKATVAHLNPGPWQTIRKHFLYNKKHVGKIYIQTNRHIVYNNEEAAQTMVDFFYNSHDGNGMVSVKVKSVRHSLVRGDYTSTLECHTLDLNLLDRIQKALDETPVVLDRLSVTSKVALTKTALVISHPHGREKMLSYGNSVTLKYSLNRVREGDKEVTKMVKVVKHQQVNAESVLRKVLLYTADTCPGSSGAPVFLLRREQPGQDSAMKLMTWVHSGGTTERKLSGSVMRELTPSEMTAVMTASENQGVPKVPALSKKCRTPPKVDPCYMWYSAYPVYVTYQKRIDSFRDQPESNMCASEKLALAGFFYAALADCVRCFHCGLGLLSWKEGNNYYAEHNRYRPDCQFLQVQIQVLGKQILTEPDGADRESGYCSSSPTGSELTLTNETQEEAYIVPGDVRPENPQESALPTKPSDGTQVETTSNILTRILKIENKALHERLMCKVCFQRPIRTVFLPCGDFLACAECARILNYCPLCCKHLENRVMIFSS